MQDDPTTCKRGYTLDNAAYAVGTVFGFNVADIARELHDDDRRRAYDLIGGGNPHTLGTPRAGVTNEH